MHFDQRQVGEYTIYTGAAEVRTGGYTAGVVVEQVHGVSNPPRRIYFNDHLSGGHVFETADQALRHAMDVGHQAVRLEIASMV